MRSEKRPEVSVTLRSTRHGDPEWEGNQQRAMWRKHFISDSKDCAANTQYGEGEGQGDHPLSK